MGSMGFRRLCFLLWMPFVLSLAACGDNKHKEWHDAGIDDGGPDDAPPDALMCPTGQMICNDTCINTTTDNNNCGACGEVCSGGTCQNGKCCPTGQTNCGGTCVDLTTNPDHCGACMNDCGNGTCQTDPDTNKTTCCGPGLTNCDGTCVDTQLDETHCGSCNGANSVCGGATETCCGGLCKDTNTDNTNCGTCGEVCDTTNSESCKDGAPPACCGTGESNCGGTCSDLTEDMFCGSCNTACASNETCKDPTVGSGVACCEANELNCNGTCRDVMSNDVNNCGACGKQCAQGESCLTGICCAPGLINCGGACVDPLTNPDNCGGCGGAGGDVCSGTNPVCSGGDCAASCAVGLELCGNACVELSNDPNHCGDCTTVCGAGQVCNNSDCVSMCDPGETSCNGACVDLDAPIGDVNHCGTCTTQCSVGQECVSGVCQTDCGIGEILCGNTCIKPAEDEANCGGCAGAGGVACQTGYTCDSGICCAPGKENVDGICCNPGEINCGGSCADPDTSAAHCGGCGQTCGAPSTCESGECCAAGFDNCGGTPACVNKQDDPQHCGACNKACAADETCQTGVCCDADSEYNAGGICCGAVNGVPTEVNCGGVCKNLNSVTSCGTTCGNAAPCEPGEVCNAGVCEVNCPQGQTACFGTCVDLNTNANHCGACGDPCAAGQTCGGGQCSACPASEPSECEAPINACVDPRDDNTNCGECGTFCVGGQHCSTTTVTIASATQSGFTATFVTTAPHFLVMGSEIVVSGMSVGGYNGAWEVASIVSTTSFTATLNVSGLGTATGGTTSLVESGMCCGAGLEACGGQCKDFLSDSANCGSCGNACAADSVCVNGACKCGFGQIECNGKCITPSVDPLNCGGCPGDGGVICGPTAPYCVSGGCVAACPAPLTGCPIGNSSNLECVNTDSDSDNCGMCGKKCDASQGLGCSAGQCVPTVDLGDDPPKCIGGGPPISVPDGNGTICTGNLGATSFTFGLCARTNIGPISRDLFTDAFDSTSGPYVATCTNDVDCGKKRCRVTRDLCSSTAQCTGGAADVCDFLVKCVAGTCAGGGIGVNGMDDIIETAPVPVAPVASNSANTHVGGSFWVFGSVGLAIKGNTQVKQRLLNQAAIDVTKTSRVYGDAIVRGDWTDGGNASMQIDGMLTTDPNYSTPACPNPLPGTLTLNTGLPNNGCTAGPFPNLAQPCGTRSELIDVKKIVRHYSNPANNDNALIGLQQTVLDNPTTSLRIDLPCGVYYLNSINAGKSVTIVVHGRTAIIVGGSIRISQKVIFDVQPNASLDIFAGGVLNVSNDTTLGSPAYPRLTRLYLGDDSCIGSGTLPQGADFTDCCSGVAINGVCTAGGGNLSQTISLSQGGHFNGLLWGGYGTFTHSNPMEMYGSIFTNHFDASGVTEVHYDNGAVQLGDECPPPSGACESCRDCNNQACVNNQCGACTADTQCCPPLVCRSGTCVLE
jgi:hypothetical protein